MDRERLENLKDLARYCVNRKVPTDFEYSLQEAENALAKEMTKLGGSINNFMRNEHDIYDIIITAADEVVPKNVMAEFGAFAEVKMVPQGDTILFKKKGLGKNRAKQFITEVGLSGVYETFRLDQSTYSIKMKAIGGGVSIDFERFLNGADSIVELMDVLISGLTEAVYGEIQKALVAAVNAPGRPTANKVISNTFEADKMLKLINTTKAYHRDVVIFAAPEFITEMGPDAIVPFPAGSNVGHAIYHPDDIDAIHYTGKINLFRGTPVVEMPQSFVDEQNDRTYINPQFGYILPAGDEKVVKVGMEGQTQMWRRDNKDQSWEVMVYKKAGVAIMSHHDWAIYQNTGIENTSVEFPYGV